MFCRNCRTELTSRTDRCISCGSKPLAGYNFCPHCGSPSQKHAQVCLTCGVAFVGALSDNVFLLTLLLAVFLGGIGIHRFFHGHIVTGILMIVTLGGFGIWYIIDLILIVTGNFKDSNGDPIKYN